MESYLDTIRRLVRDQGQRSISNKLQAFDSYEDYLHQNHIKHYSRTPHLHKPPKNHANRKENNPLRTHLAPETQTHTVYFPVERKEVDYETRVVRQKVPKTVKKVDLVERREVELVPKEVRVTDYYAIEHVRQYLKEVVSEVKVQKVIVPKTIKKYQTIPVEKQIIFYPSHITDIQEAKRQAREYLEARGVLIRPEADYRPITDKESIHDAFLRPKTEEKKPVEEQSVLQTYQKAIREQSDFQIANDSYIHLCRPLNRNKPYQDKNETSITQLQKTSMGGGGKEQGSGEEFLPSPILQQTAALPLADFSFADRDKYRYDLARCRSLKRHRL